MIFKEKTRQIVHENPRFKVEETCFELENQEERYFYQVKKPDACVIIVHAQGKILLMEVARPHNRKTSYELPGGRIEGFEAPVNSAIRELSEETGIQVEKLTKLTTTLPLPGVADEKVYIFSTELEKEVSIKIDKNARSEGLVSGNFFTFKKIKQLIQDGKIICSIDAFAIYFFINKIEENKF
jgi:ADP-ribose pyrophosphatase